MGEYIEAKFRLPKSSPCYGCEHYVDVEQDEEVDCSSEFEANDLLYGGICACSEACNSGDKNKYKMK